MSSAPTQSSRAETSRSHPRPTAAGVSPRSGSWQQWLLLPQRERTCLIVLAVAIALSIAVGLTQTSGATFSTDEYLYFVVNRGFHLKTLLSPHNGNLTVVIRLLYAIVFKLVGPEYLVFRILLFLEVAVTAVLVYVLVRRRVGPVAGLALTLPLLFLGSSTDVALSTIGVQHLLCLIASLGALLALEADSRRGDALACVLLIIAVATFSAAFAFVAAVAAAVLLRNDRWRRAWIFAIPIGLYLLWLVAAPKYSGPGYLGTTHVRATNVLLAPSFFADAAAAVAAGVSGLSYDFARTGPSPVLTNWVWGVPLAAAGVALLVWRVSRGAVNRWFWSYLAIPLVFWLSIVMTIEPNRFPNSDRYIYTGAVALLLVAAEALRGVRWSAGALAGLLSASVVALTGNIAQLRVDGSALRATGANERSVLAAIELARDHVAPSFLPPQAPYEDLLIVWGNGVERYLQAVDRNGSFAFSVPELRRQSEAVRELADSTLVAALRIHLRPARAIRPTAACLRVPPGVKARTHLTLRPPGAVLWSAKGGAVLLGRFGSAQSVNVGSLRPRQYSTVAIPRDRTSVPWRVSVPGGVQVVCEPPSGRLP